MSQNVEEVKRTIQQLPAAEQKELLEWFEEHKPAIDEEASEEELEARVLNRLLEKGLISEIPPRWDDDDEDFEPIEIEGEPLSQMIIRERR
jgi:hypothetical protein